MLDAKSVPHEPVRIESLKSHALFGGLESENLAFFLSFMKEETYTRGETILREGDSADSLYYVVNGSVEVLKTVSTASDASMERIATLGRGETFGEMAILDLLKRSATVRTLEDTHVLSLTNTDLLRIAKARPKTYAIIVMNLAREVSRRLRMMDDRYAITIFSHRS